MLNKDIVDIIKQDYVSKRHRRCSNGFTMTDIKAIEGSDRKYWKRKQVHKDWFQIYDENELNGKLKRKKDMGIKNINELRNKYAEMV